MIFVIARQVSFLQTEFRWSRYRNGSVTAISAPQPIYTLILTIRQRFLLLKLWQIYLNCLMTAALKANGKTAEYNLDFRSGTTGIFQKSQKFCPSIQQFCPLKIEQKQRFPKNSKACNHCNYRLCWRRRWDSNPRALADNRISSFLCNWYMWWYCWSLEVILSALWCCKNQSITALKGEDPLKIQWVRSQSVFAPIFDLWAELRAESGRTKFNGNT